MTTAAAAAEKTQPAVKKKSQFVEVMKRLGDNRGAVAGGIIFLAVLLIAVFAPRIAPYGYNDLDILNRCLKPCAEHWFGTDQLGRDILSRVIYGARYSLLIGIGSVVFSAVFGVIIGAIAGYFGGWLDIVIMRLCDIIQSIPGMILNIALACVLGPGVMNTILALGFEGIAGTARLMRSSILNVRKMEYLDAARTSNCSSARIIIKHVFPNTFAPILVQATMGVGGRIMMAASMSYVGIGVQPPTPEWGAIISGGRSFLFNAPWISIFPGVFLAVTGVGLSLLGDGLAKFFQVKGH